MALGFRSLAAVVAVWSGSLLLPAQSTDVQNLGVGKLLVARGGFGDSVFAETVILLVRYDHDGTMGITINRPTKVPISRALRELKGAGERSDPVYSGGPVGLQNVLGLLNASAMPEGAIHVTGKTYLVSNKPLMEKTLTEHAGPGEFRVYLGYCGWGPEQLENEVRQGVWHVLTGNQDLVFDPDPESLWSRLRERVEQRIALARVPPGRTGLARLLP